LYRFGANKIHDKEWIRLKKSQKMIVIRHDFSHGLNYSLIGKEWYGKASSESTMNSSMDNAIIYA
jgi:hypothetical protein